MFPTAYTELIGEHWDDLLRRHAGLRRDPRPAHPHSGRTAK